MEYALVGIIAVICSVAVVSICASNKISELEFNLGLKNRENDILRARLNDEYQTGWNEAMHTCAKLAQKKRSAGGVRDDRERKAD